MGYGLIQLVANGAEDIILTRNPQITLFKCIYRRYINFSQDEIDLPVEGKQNFGSQMQSKVVRGGDLLSKLFLTLTLPEICMKYNLTSEEETQKILNSVGVVPQPSQTPIEA